MTPDRPGYLGQFLKERDSRVLLLRCHVSHGLTLLTKGPAMAPVKRVISPTLNPAGLMATAGAVYAATAMILNAYHGHGVIDPPVIIAAVGAVAALLTRQVVTPVADPKDGNGN